MPPEDSSLLRNVYGDPSVGLRLAQCYVTVRTTVMRTPHNVMLYVHYLFCCMRMLVFKIIINICIVMSQLQRPKMDMSLMSEHL